MSANGSQSSNGSTGVSDGRAFRGGDDRRCRYCNEVALAFDPEAERPRCRACNELC